MTEGKQKLTLSVDSETVDRAKSLGINISDLTEQVLRSFTFKPEDAEDSALREQRENLFEAMTPLLRRYRTTVIIGQLYDEDEERYPDPLGEVFLEGDGNYSSEGYRGPYFSSQDAEAGTFTLKSALDTGHHISFYPTETILKNFMKTIEDAKSKRKQQVASLAVARRIVEAITQVDEAETRTARTRSKGGGVP